MDDSEQGQSLTRRRFLAGLGATAVVVGWNWSRRRWVRADEGCDFANVPSLDGVLLQDAKSLDADSTDQGNIAHQRPCAILRPANVGDIQKMIRFCRRYGIPVATRGEGHTTFGQALVSGLVIESGSLNKIHALSPAGADVDAGVLWKDVVTAAHRKGLTPPVLTGYLGLSVGGTLSVGGVPVGNRRGLQVDRARELEVVTGTGDVKRCSMNENRDLFEAMLGGIGQCGVITRVKMDLIPAPDFVRTYRIHYSDNAQFFADLRTLLERNEFDDVYCQWMPNGTGLIYELNASMWWSGLDLPPARTHLLRGLTTPAAAAIEADMPYLAYVFQVDLLVKSLQLSMSWDRLLKPWFDVWLPDQVVESYVGDVISQLTPEDVGPGGLVLLFPQLRTKLTRPFLRVPEPALGGWVYLFDILGASLVPGSDPGFTQRMLTRNRRLFERARDAGATRYPIGALEFTPEDWERQYGEMWPEFVRRKRRYDPDGILTPGPGIF